MHLQRFSMATTIQEFKIVHKITERIYIAAQRALCAWERNWGRHFRTITKELYFNNTIKKA